MVGFLGSIAKIGMTAFANSDTGRRWLNEIGLDPSMFNPPPQYHYNPNPYSAPPSMDMYQRDYVSRAEMDYMGPSAMSHVQEAARNGPSIRVIRRKPIKRKKKAKK